MGVGLIVKSGPVEGEQGATVEQNGEERHRREPGVPGGGICHYPGPAAGNVFNWLTRFIIGLGFGSS